MVNVVDVADPFNPIEHAGLMLDRHAAGDSTVPNLLEVCLEASNHCRLQSVVKLTNIHPHNLNIKQVTGVQQHRMATASGLNDYDYQKLSTLTRNEAIGLNQIETVGKVPIPPEIMEHFKRKRCDDNASEIE